MTPTAALIDLLLALFSDHELRAFVAHRLPGGRIAGALPGAPCTLERLADQTAQALERQGLVMSELFEALLAAVPGRRVDIERVAVTWGLPAFARGATVVGADAAATSNPSPAPHP